MFARKTFCKRTTIFQLKAFKIVRKLEVKVKSFPKQSQHLMTLKKKQFENYVVTEFSPVSTMFPTCYHNVPLPKKKQKSIFQSHSFCCLKMLSIWTVLKFCHWYRVKCSNYLKHLNFRPSFPDNTFSHLQRCIVSSCAVQVDK